MLKYLAILKDSLREAIDTKVFFVMVGLSVALTLLTATLTFKPQPPDDVFRALLVLPLFGDVGDLDPERFMNMAFGANSHAYEVRAIQPLYGAPEGPDSPYALTVIAHCKSEAEARELMATPAATEQLIHDRLGRVDDLRLVKVEDVRLERSVDPPAPQARPNEVAFHVTVQPTPVARRLWPHEPSLFFGALPLSTVSAPLGFQLYVLEDHVIGGLGAWVTVLVSVVLTAFFIPNMVRKGTVDFLLVKPIHRPTLLLYKYLGGLIFIFLNTAVIVLGVWLALGWRSGIWAPSFLLLVFAITFFFAILYSVSTLFAVRSGNAIVAILMTCAVWFALFLTGSLNQLGERIRQDEEQTKTPLAERTSENLFFKAVRVAHTVLPRTKDLDTLTSQLLARDLLTANQVSAQKIDKTRISWGESLTVSGLFIAVMLGLACWRFSARDY